MIQLRCGRQHRGIGLVFDEVASVTQLDPQHIMQLYLVRHAESENNAKAPEQRTEDPSITELGRQQADHLGRWTETLEIDVLITSPFRRAIQTTTAILKRSPQHTHVWHDIFERGGCYRGYHPQDLAGAKGLGRSQIIGELPGEASDCTIDDSINDSGWWGERTPESDQEAAHRAQRVAQRLISTFGGNGQTVVAVTHADFKRLLLGILLSDAVDPSRLGALRNTGVTKLDYDGDRWSLDWFNSVSHLPGRLITGNES